MTWPPAFESEIAILLKDNCPEFFHALESSTPVSIRLNQHKLKLANIQQRHLLPVPWAERGLYLPERPIFTLDPRFHGGGYYVQDASCMLIEAVWKQISKPSGPLLVLDLCAAPGGKTTHLASLLPEKSVLFANEVVPSRAQILLENCIKWGYDRMIVTQNHAKDFQALPFQFDLILVDAPCSGEGLFRKQAQAVHEWSDSQVDVCSQRQSDILKDIWPCLKPGGTLVYSTCTWNRRENESVIALLSQKADVLPFALHFPDEWNIQTSSEMPLYRCWPHLVQGEGFSLAVLQKDHSTEAKDLELSSNQRQAKRSSKKMQKPASKTLNQGRLNRKRENDILVNWLKEASTEDLLWHDQFCWFWPSQAKALLDAATIHLRVLSQGICLAELKGKDLCPAPALALYPGLEQQSFGIQSLNLASALAFLRTEALAGSGKGWQLIEFEGFALGWGKATPTHINNAWPKAWKIRQDFKGLDPDMNLKLLPDFVQP
jgi:16S rRNA C967 or C1407 C5-methylase (RsmB/RsmF family)/NOL1/NOP2/fmu family ribosome biogenesis protein